MGSADYFYKIDDSKTAVILEAKQELNKKHIKNLDNGGDEALLFNSEDLSTNIEKTDSFKINNRKVKSYLRKKIVDFDKYSYYTKQFIETLNQFISDLKIKKLNSKEENVKKYIIEPVLDLIEYNRGSMEHGVDNEKYKSPEEQVKSYLGAKEFTDYKVYGILSNGLVWKLYYKDKNNIVSKEPIAIFDLSLLLDDSILDSEKNKLSAYFVEVFKFGNLLANEKNFKCSLMDNLLEIDDCIYAESLELSERLFTNIINKGYIELAKGIASASKKNNINLTSEQLEQYSMKILFRLIFILYAESRGFLPLNQSTYYSRYSIESIAIQLGKNKEKDTPIEDDLWARINDLFRTIDNGKMGGNIKVPVYNGGLFREYKDDLLNKIYIENKYLIEVLFSLIYHEKKITYDRIDYNLLDVKYIGTIYEKLLDYKIIEYDGRYSLKAKGENNKRKGLGAYYTPDNVTAYMIKESVDKKIILFKNQFNEAYNNVTMANIHTLQDCCIIKKIFDLRIIDISCGSGHFLIDTIEYLSNICLEIKDYYENYDNFHSETIALIKGKQDKINNNEEFVSSSLQEATFRDVCKRFILKKCIYGIDINPLATDITKFAIWLETFIVGIPLSFMDNHIRCGNSVLGFIDNIYNDIDLTKIALTKDNLFLDDLTRTFNYKKGEILKLINEITDLSYNINTNTDITVNEVDSNYADYSKIDSKVNYIKFNLIPLTIFYYILRDASIVKTLNVKSNSSILNKILEALSNAMNYVDIVDFTQTYYIFSKKPEILYDEINKLKIPKNYFKELLLFITEKREQLANKISKIIDTVYAHNFNNWFIEFPNIKFDIVIGNPPYVRADTDGDFSKQREVIVNSFDYETLYEKWDLMMAFVERGFKLLKEDGILSLIIKDDYLKAKYASKSREYFIENSKINRIDFLSDIQVFSGVGVKNIIIEYQKTSNKSNSPLRLKHTKEFKNITVLDSDLQSEIQNKAYNEEDINDSIGVYSDCIEWGGIFYLSKSMVLQSDEKKAKGQFTKDDLISNSKDRLHTKEYIEGKDIEPYFIERVRYLEWDTERCPALVSRPTFPELYIFPKIMMGSMTSGIYDDSGLVSNHSVLISTKWENLKEIDNKSIKMSIGKYFGIKGEEILRKKDQLVLKSMDFDTKYCLSILNSSFAKKYFEKTGRSSVGLYPDDIKKLPIKKIPLEEQLKFSSLVNEITLLKQDVLMPNTSVLEKQLDEMVSSLYED
ncbi:MAG: Eco57I restriction-modification methylase domain-containing protein [Campylobacterota bacterium]|nr:Eco57I restriction-modification methylase domain-containing protein [Campylobacterota bacterium]